MTHGPLNGAMDDFVYDSRRRLTQAGTTQYVYDAENNRIGVNSTRFVVNSQPALSQVLVKDENGNKTFYVYGLGLIGEESAAGYKAYHFDFRGSTVALSDESGEVLERFSYSAYGVLLSGDATQTPFLFNGQYGVMTDGNGLYHMRARFYSAEIRRFLNRDVLVGDVARGQSLNRFGFVTGRPVAWVDPLGLESPQAAGCIPKI
jgi:RHS repeat-associated protein